MNVLAINHYFEQDIEAFVSAGGSHRYWPISFRYFTPAAERVFSKPVFTGLEAFHRAEYEEQRVRYAQLAQKRVHELYSVFPFDIVLAPSDTFFWVRAVIDAVHELGIPFVVLQKEATVTEAIMGDLARELGSLFPFIGDWMFVSSEHHRRFWTDSGADPRRISVTGQPRFDFYRQPKRWKSWKDLGLELDPARRNVLFFTYDSSAYLPMWVRDGLSPWLQMRRETEEVLLQLAKEEDVNIIIKPHPQPAEDQTDHLRTLTRHPHVYALDGAADTRQLIVNSDVVIGFQSTVMFESMAAGKKTIYTYWTSPVLEAGDSLVPFHRMDDALDVAKSPHDLKQLVCAATSISDSAVRQRAQAFEQYLGPLDGLATDRCLAIMCDLSVRFENQSSPAARALRAQIVAQSRAVCRRALPRAFMSAVAWKLTEHVLLRLYPLWKMIRKALWWKRTPPTPEHVYQQVITDRSAVASEWLQQCVIASNGK